MYINQRVGVKGLYKKIVGLVIVGGIFYFIGGLIYREWEKISQYNWSPQPVWLFLSIIVLFMIYLMSAYGWTIILKRIGAKVDIHKSLSIFLLSIFGRYIPGGVWSALGRMYLCRLAKIPDSLSGVSIILEQAYPIISAGIVFAISLLFWDNSGSFIKIIPAVVMIPLFLVFIHPRPFLMILNPLLTRVRRGPIRVSLSFTSMLVLTLYYSIYWIITGLAFYLFIRSFYPISFSYIPLLSGIYAISFTAGYLTFFTPAGLGVREGSLTILLSFFIPTPIAVGVAILSRIWLIGVELILLLWFLAHSETRRMVRAALDL